MADKEYDFCKRKNKINKFLRVLRGIIIFNYNREGLYCVIEVL